MLIGGGHDHEYVPEKHHPQQFRYPDGCYISRHPSTDEINAHWKFWMGQLSEEQLEVYEAQRDMQVYNQYVAGPPKLQTLSKDEAVERAIKFWTYYYPGEVEEFLDYIRMKRETLKKSSGMNDAGLGQLYGAIPGRIQHLVKLYNKEMIITLPGERFSEMHKIFYRLFPKARIANQ